MAVLNIHNAVVSCSVLLEYRGTPSAVVLMIPYGVTGSPLKDVLLALARNQSLQGWANMGLAGVLTTGVQLLPVRTVQADVNGFAFAVVPTAALLSAGQSLRVEATEIA